MSNNSREQILSAIRGNIPREPVEHPQVPVFRRTDAHLKSAFEKHLQEAGGVAHDIGNPTEAQARLASLHPTT